MRFVALLDGGHAGPASRLGAAVAALWLFSPALAAAQVPGEAPHVGPTILSPRAPQSPASAWDRSGLGGIELEARGGIMFAGGQSPVQAHGLYPGSAPGNPTGAVLDPASCPSGRACTPYSVDPFGLAFTVGWRFWPRISAGAFFSYAAYQATNGADTGDAPDSTSQLSRNQWVLGAYGRYYLTEWSSRLQPWAELGVGFSRDSASYERPIGLATNAQPETGFYSVSATGFAFPLTVGLDWRLAPAFSFGPMVGYEVAVPLGGCVEVDVDRYSPVPGRSTCGSPVTTRAYGVLSGGIFAKATFGSSHDAP